MTNSALVSVIIPAYNHERYVHGTLESIRTQTHRQIEIIAINDGSTDNTATVIEKFSSAHAGEFVRFVFIDKRNEGITATLNQGIALSEGEFVFIIASDDVVADPDAIKLLVDEITASETIGMACGDADFIDNAGKPIECTRNGKPFKSFVDMNFPTAFGLDKGSDFGAYKTFLVGNYIPVGMLVRKSVYGEIGFYVKGQLLEDYEFWLRLSKRYRFAFHNAALMHYRVHGLNTGSVRANSIRQEVGHLLLREREYAKENGYLKYWQRGACKAGLHLYRTPTPGNLLLAFRLLFLSVPAWRAEFPVFFRLAYNRIVRDLAGKPGT